jgi:hypothetical protein
MGRQGVRLCRLYGADKDATAICSCIVLPVNLNSEAWMKRFNPVGKGFPGPVGNTGIIPADTKCFLWQEWGSAQPGETFLPAG